MCKTLSEQKTAASAGQHTATTKTNTLIHLNQSEPLCQWSQFKTHILPLSLQILSKKPSILLKNTKNDPTNSFQRKEQKPEETVQAYLNNPEQSSPLAEALSVNGDTKYPIYKHTHVRKERDGVQTCRVATRRESGRTE